MVNRHKWAEVRGQGRIAIIAALLASGAFRAEAFPTLRAVRTQVDAGDSSIVEFSDGRPRVITTIVHRPGFPPAVTFSGEHIFVTEPTREGARLVELHPDGRRELLAPQVARGFGALATEAGVVVAVSGGRIDRGSALPTERWAVVELRGDRMKALVESESFLLWPFSEKDGKVWTLDIGPEGTAVFRGEERIPFVFAELQVRDPVFDQRGRLLVSARGAHGAGSVLRFGTGAEPEVLASAPGTVLGQPLSKDRVAVSISPDWRSGDLFVFEGDRRARVNLPAASPILQTARGDWLVVRLQNETGHRHILLDLKGCSPTRDTCDAKIQELEASGGVLSSFGWVGK